MRNNKHDVLYFLLALLLSVIFWLIQRPLLEIIINLISGGDGNFISVADYTFLYVLGSILLSSALAWKLKSKREGMKLSPKVFLGMKIRRGALLTVSLVLILISLLRFDIFTPNKVHSINLLSMKVWSSIPYTDITNIDILTTFQKRQRRPQRLNGSCRSIAIYVSYNIQSKENQISGIIPFNSIDRLGELVKANKIPHTVNYVNYCKNYQVPEKLKSPIENAFEVRFDI